MQCNGSDPPNGARVTDPVLMAILRAQSDKTDWIIHSLGGVQQQLKHGHELHHTLISRQETQGHDIRRIDAEHRKTRREVRRLRRRRFAVPSAEDLKDTIKAAREAWQYILLAVAVAGKIIQWFSTHLMFGAS